MAQTPGRAKETTALLVAVVGADATHTMEDCDATLRREIVANGGQVFKTLANAYFVAFEEVRGALAAAASAQRALGASRDPSETAWVRMAVDVARVAPAGQSVLGPAVDRAARLVAAAHEGQILVSAAAARASQDARSLSWSLRDLGWHGVRHLGTPERVYQLVAPGLPTDFPPPKALETVPNNLPIQSTSFVGRAAEVEALRKEIGESRLTTLVGAGGVGKTRLALHIGSEALDSYPDGVWFVDLGDRKNGDDLAFAVAGVWQDLKSTGQITIDTVTAALRQAHVLLILDNCEHLVEAAARFVNTLMERCPAVSILATSREPLGIRGEHIRRVASLPSPEHSDAIGVAAALSFPAVELFVDRARAAKADFSIEDDVATVVRIVRLLDGIPLAIELAARRLRMYPAKQLDAMLGERLTALSQNGGPAVPRHRTMRALIDWSYELLDPDERRLFARLAVFAGSCSLESVRAVAADDIMRDWKLLELLESLVDKSLVDAAPHAVQPRYRLLEATRQFALEKLQESGDEARLRGAHARHFADLAATIETSMETMTESGWSALYAVEVDNFRGALDWATSNDLALAVTIAASLGPLWEQLSLAGEGLARSEAVLEALSVNAKVPGALAIWVAVADMAFQWRAMHRAIETAQTAITLAEAAHDEIARAKAIAIRASADLWNDDVALPSRRLVEALEVFRRRKVTRWARACIFRLGLLDLRCSKYDAAQARFDEILATRQAWPSFRRKLEVMLNECTFARGEVRAAIDEAQASVDRSRATGSKVENGWWCNLASYFTASGDLETAVTYARIALEVPRWAQDRAFAPFTLQTVALIATKSGNAAVGAQLLGYVDASLDGERLARHMAERIILELLNSALAERLAQSEIAYHKLKGATLGDDAARELGLHLLNDRIQVGRAFRTRLNLLQDRIDIGNVAARPTVQELALLALLAASKRPVPLSQVCDALWPDVQPRAARAALHTCVHRLRKKTIQNIVVQAEESYAIGDGIEVDLRQLREPAASMRRKRELDDADLDELARIGSAIRNRNVVGLFRYDWFAVIEAELIDLYNETAERLLSELSKRGRHADVVACTETMLADDPCDEVAAEHCIRAQLNLGDRLAAAQTFDCYRNAIKRELDEEPSPQIRSLAARFST